MTAKIYDSPCSKSNQLQQVTARRQLLNFYLEEQNFYADCQHGFMKGRSTLTNLLVTLECWTSTLEDGSGLDVIYLDYKKAFDTVPHQKLLQKLKGLKLGDTLTKWVGQFLLGRQMRVHVNGSFSSWINVISGVCWDRYYF